ncbi:hypothetical protein BJ165DRAFT_1513373 [Panaeolus papilionaceus]|nr:hypothetical protein BJ165DRAFT_1513373 [Panaeolus papilionaceus]
MNCAPFPIELFELIVDNLANVAPGVMNTDGCMALRACSLVCKAFVALSRRHLFRDINIGLYPCQEMSVSRSRLIEVLKRNPAISSYIRGVTYTFHATKEPEELKRARELGNYLSYHADEYSTSLCELFRNIHTLCIRCGLFAGPHEPHYDSEPDYAGMKKQRFSLYQAILRDFAGSLTHTVTTLTICGLPMGLLDFLIFPSLRSLVLVDVLWLSISNITQKTLFQLEPPSKIERITVEFGEPFPVDILRFLPNLVHVDVGSMSLLSSDGVWPIFLKRDDYNRPVVVYNKLQHIVIGNVQHFVPICDAADSGNTPKHVFPVLCSLKIPLSPYNLRVASEMDDIYMLLRHSPNLTQLEILGLDATLRPQLDHRIGRYGTSLEHLRLEYGYPDDLAIPHSVLAIRDALSPLEGNNQLKTLELNVCVNIGQVQEWFRTFSGAWKTVDQMLGGNEKAGFPYLEELSVSLIICDYRPGYDEWGVVEVPEVHEFDSEETFWGLWVGCLTLLHSNSRVTRRYNPNFNFKYSSAKSQRYQLEFLGL